MSAIRIVAWTARKHTKKEKPSPGGHPLVAGQPREQQGCSVGVGDQALSSAGFAMLGMPSGCRQPARHPARGSRRPAGTLDVRRWRVDRPLGGGLARQPALRIESRNGTAQDRRQRCTVERPSEVAIGSSRRCSYWITIYSALTHRTARPQTTICCHSSRPAILCRLPPTCAKSRIDRRCQRHACVDFNQGQSQRILRQKSGCSHAGGGGRDRRSFQEAKGSRIQGAVHAMRGGDSGAPGGRSTGSSWIRRAG